MDSGASDHMSHQKDLFINYKKYENPIEVRIGNGATIFSYGKGDISVLCFDGENWTSKTLLNVLYVPDIKLNLFSEGAALEIRV